MGNKSKTKKIIPAIIIVALFFTQISFPYETFGAEKLNWNNPTKGGGPNFKFNAANLSSSMVSVIGCTGLVNRLEKEVGSVVASIAKKRIDKMTTKAGLSGGKSAGLAAGATASSPGSQAGISISNWIMKTLTETFPEKTTDSDAKDRDERTAARNECLNGVAINLARNQLVEMTRATMEWVNTGFGGDPLYVRNMNKLMNSIENEIITAEMKLFKNPNDYPFGRDYVKSVINAKNIKDDFASSMKTDLSVFLNLGNENLLKNGGYIESYTKDFSLGGWIGWLGLTQRPQNNPLGSTLAMTNHLDEKVENEKKYIESEIEANDGMLSQKKCVKWIPDSGSFETTTIVDGIPVQKTIEGTTVETTTIVDGVPVTERTVDKNNPENCIEWEVVTPGSIIKDKVSTHLNSPERQSELVKTVNDLLFGLFSSLITNFQQGGLSSLKPTASESTFNYEEFGGFGSNPGDDDIMSTNEERENWGGWVNGGSFDITKDLPDIIKTQKDFIEQANIYVKKYPERISALGELDYCIPGPNASWKENMIDVRDAYKDYLESIFAKFVSLPGSDNDYTTISSALRNNYEKMIQKSDLFPIIKISPFFSIIRERSGKTFKESGIKARADFWSTYVQSIEKEYIKKIDNTYGPDSPMQTPYNIDGNGNVLGENTNYLPMARIGLSLTKNLKEEGEEIETIKKEYKDYITEANVNLYRLEKIKKEIDALMKKGTKAREDARKEAGLDPIDESCLLKEEVSYLGNE